MSGESRYNNQSLATDEIVIEGAVERIVYVNEEDQYTVAKIQEGSKRSLTTIVGNFASISPGETLRLKGRWVNSKSYGEQFHVNGYMSIMPATVNAIRKYLGSGLIKGIGPRFAERIVNRFGVDTLNIIENDINRLSIIEGIGKKRMSWIQNAWIEQKGIREIMIFLQSCGVGSSNAVKIYKEYGSDSISVLKENPYKLAMDITGIGFKTADRIAQKMGIPFNSGVRVKAGIVFLLQQVTDEGHVFYPYEDVIRRSMNILAVTREDVSKAIEELKETNVIVIEDANRLPVYLKGYYLTEISVSERLVQISKFLSPFPPINIEKAISWISERLLINLADGQKMAIRAAIEDKVIVITGGPGVGKTTVINAIIKIFEVKGLKILLAAPTGRAAKRLSEATGKNGMTIHRLLKFNVRNKRFEFNEDNPLKADVFIIDEVSMVDILLMHHLVKAIPLDAKLILVGDIDQLPSVGPGNVLKDIINSKVIATIRLTEIFRQASQSLIVENAHRINNGKYPILPYKPMKNSDLKWSSGEIQYSDFYFIGREDPKDIVDTIKHLCRYEIPARFGLDPFKDIQVLTPMHKGEVGATALNRELQEALNPQQPFVVCLSRKFCVKDKVMQIRNNYEKDVFNGDIGRIVGINKVDAELLVEFDDKRVSYDFSELDELVLAYAITVHKSQGNEYPAIILPLSIQHYIMLQRNLIYTAITRGKRLVVIVGMKRAVAIAVSNNKISARYTRLQELLKKFVSPLF